MNSITNNRQRSDCYRHRQAVLVNDEVYAEMVSRHGSGDHIGVVDFKHRNNSKSNFRALVV